MVRYDQHASKMSLLWAHFDYKLDEFLCNNPIYYLEMSCETKQLITEKTRVSNQSESTIDVIQTPHLDMHKNLVLTNTN